MVLDRAVRQRQSGELLRREDRIKRKIAPAFEPPGSGRHAGARWLGTCEPVAARPAQHPPSAPRRAAHGRLGYEPLVATAQPGPAGCVSAPLAAQLPHGRAVAVLDSRLRAQFQPPARLLEAPAQVGVLGGPDALIEAADLLECDPAHQQVRRDRPRAVGVREMRLLAEEAAGGAVAGGERVGVGAGGDLTGQCPDARGHGLAEIRIEQSTRRAAVGVEEQDPVAARARRAGVAGVRGRAFAGRSHDREPVTGADEARYRRHSPVRRHSSARR